MMIEQGRYRQTDIASSCYCDFLVHDLYFLFFLFPQWARLGIPLACPICQSVLHLRKRGTGTGMGMEKALTGHSI